MVAIKQGVHATIASMVVNAKGIVQPKFLCYPFTCCQHQMGSMETCYAQYFIEMCAYSIHFWAGIGGVFLCMKFQNGFMDYKMSPEPTSTFICWVVNVWNTNFGWTILLNQAASVGHETFYPLSPLVLVHKMLFGVNLKHHTRCCCSTCYTSLHVASSYHTVVRHSF